MKLNKNPDLSLIASSISIIAVGLAIFAWGQSLQWHIWGTSTYLLFPVFGLIAFSLLWSQYMAIAIRNAVKADGKLLSLYFKITGYLVLLTILLHPGLLIWQLWRDGAGLPPSSYEHYVIPSLKWVVILGMINLVILLLFELHRFFGKWHGWKYFGYLVDLVMLSIFYHGLRLGLQLQHGWYKGVWFFYGLTLIAALAYIYWLRYQKYSKKAHDA